MKILVTGCTGFIGSNLVKVLSERDYLVYGLSRHRQGDKDMNPNCIEQDLSQPLAIDALPSDVDCIIHLAANMSKSAENLPLFQVNTMSTLHLLEYGRNRGIKKFVFASTGGVYGYSVRPRKENSPVNPVGFYALSKYLSELLVSSYPTVFSTVILRLFFPYGTGQQRGLVPLLAEKIRSGESIILNNRRGSPIINPIYIDDAIEAIIRTISVKESPLILNVAGNERVSILRLSKIIGETLGLEPRYTLQENPGISNLIGDTSALREKLQFIPRISLTNGLSNMMSNNVENSKDS